jgi:hypothetical protein
MDLSISALSHTLVVKARNNGSEFPKLIEYFRTLGISRYEI